MGSRIVITMAPLFLVNLIGCGASEQTPLTATQMEDVRLRDVAELYREHQVSVKKPPRSLKDFQKLGDAGAPTGFSALRKGDVVVRWEATLPDTDPEPSSPESDQVLAYGKTVPEQGGPVLMLDRRIRTMTPEDFKAAKFAGVQGSTTQKTK